MAHFEIPVDIEEVQSEQVEFTPTNEIMITVTRTGEGTPCPQGGKDITVSHGYGRESRRRHVPIGGKPTYIRMRPTRDECPYGGDHPPTTQQ